MITGIGKKNKAELRELILNQMETIEKSENERIEATYVLNEIKKIYEWDANINDGPEGFLDSVKEREEIYDKHTNGDFISSEDYTQMEDFIADNTNRMVVDREIFNGMIKTNDHLKEALSQSVPKQIWSAKVKECDEWKEKFVHSSHLVEHGIELELNNQEEKKRRILENYINQELLCGDPNNDTIENFNEWAEGMDNPSYYTKDMEGYQWEMVQDTETDEYYLTKVKIQNSVKEWVKLQESGDSDPELLLNAIAEKCGLKPIEWGTTGCAEKSYELWEKVADEMEER